MNNRSFSSKLREIVPLTPQGLKHTKSRGRKKMVASVTANLASLPNDDLAHVDALVLFLADEAKHPGRTGFIDMMAGLNKKQQNFVTAAIAALVGPSAVEFNKLMDSKGRKIGVVDPWLTKHGYLTEKGSVTALTKRVIKSELKKRQAGARPAKKGGAK